MVYLNQQNPYTMEVDCGNRNCYNCRGFGHLTRNCRNKRLEGRIGEKRKLEYKNGNNRERRMIKERNRQNNLNGKQDLILFN